MYIVAILCGIAILKNDELEIPRLPRKIFISFGVFALIAISNYFVQRTSVLHSYTLDRASLFILVFASYLFFRKKREANLLAICLAVSFSTAAVISFGVVEFYQCRWQRYVIASNCFPSTFGNINMTAQFLGFSLLFQLTGLSQLSSRVGKWWLTVVAVCTLTYIYFSLCRSVYLATVGALIIYLILGDFKKRKDALMIVSLASLLIFFINIFSRQENPCPQMKGNSNSYRLETWGETLRMIRENPLGVGVGRFEFGFVPYQMGGERWPLEGLVDRSPHNEYLRILAEDGVPFFVAGLAMVLLVLIIAFRLGLAFWRSSSGIFIAIFFIFLAIEMMFQFPLENAMPFFLTALCLGLLLDVLSAHGSSKSWQKRVRVTASILVLIFASLCVAHAISKYLEAQYSGDSAKSLLACNLAPYNWRACLNQVRAVADSDPAQAFTVLRAELGARPYNHAALGFWGVLALKGGHKGDGCRALVLRDLIFNNMSSYSIFIAQNCLGEIGGVVGDFQDEYKKWLTSHQITTTRL